MLALSVREGYGNGNGTIQRCPSRYTRYTFSSSRARRCFNSRMTLPCSTIIDIMMLSNGMVRMA